MFMKKKKVLIKEREIELYNNKVRITRDSNDNISFEVNNYITYDLLEGVIFCLKYEQHKDNPLLKIQLKQLDFYNIDTIQALYWLSGGDEEWMENDHYSKKWAEVCTLFADRFTDSLLDEMMHCNTIGDIAKVLMTYYNITYMYDYALSIGIVK